MPIATKTALRTGGKWLLTPVGLACVITIGITDLLLGASVSSGLYELGLLGQRPVTYYPASGGIYFGFSIVLFCLLLYLFAVVARVAVADRTRLSMWVFVEDWSRLLRAAGVSVVLLLTIAVGTIVLLIGGYFGLRSVMPDFPAALLTLLLPYLWAAVIVSIFIYGPFVMLDEGNGIVASLRRSWHLSAGSRLRTVWLGILSFGVGAVLALVVVFPLGLLFSTGPPLAEVVAVVIPGELFLVYPIGVFGRAYLQLHDRETDRSASTEALNIENV